MTSRRAHPPGTPVSLAGGAPRRNRTGDPILVKMTPDRHATGVFAARVTPQAMGPPSPTPGLNPPIGRGGALR
jgi:hypothetical protein